MKEETKKKVRTAFIQFLDVIKFMCVLFTAFIIGRYFNDEDINPWLQDINYQLEDRISEDQIHLYQHRLVIDGEYKLSGFKDTNSMLPIIDQGSNGIFISYDENITLRVGEIIAYNKDNQTIVHRIIGVGEADGIFYYVVKGDNNDVPDDPVTPNMIKYVLIGVIW